MDSDHRSPKRTGITRTRITPQLRQLRFDAGSLALNLISTVGRRASTRIERLGSAEVIGQWCDGVGLELRTGEDTPELLDRLHELREACYVVLSAVVHERDPDDAPVAVVNRMAGAALPVPVLTAEGARVSTPALTGPQVCAVVVRDLFGLVADPAQRHRLRECDSPLCRTIYVDSTGGRPRRWCSARCGNASKVADHRARNRLAGN